MGTQFVGQYGAHGEGECTLNSYFDVRPVSKQFRHGAVEFEVFETRHTPGKLCFGALINGWLMYSGDTLPLPDRQSAQP